MNKHNKKIGKLGEEIAEDYLEKNNYEIIEKNFRCLSGEIDIIVKDLKTNEIVFVEVKTRTNNKFGLPVEAVNNNKKIHILKTARYFLYKNRIENINIRIDIIEVLFKRKYYKINHLRQVI